MSTVAQTMEDMQEEIARLRAELQNAAKAALDAVALSCAKEREADALRVDAERYRFIRDADRSDEKLGYDQILTYSQETLDEAIDAAMGASA
ncbi:hypothetical protein [Stenotrophomonas maltophilia]|uniref:hypothetical protein n=1 Tax=Stenotrophomonas maltophilia TaxID=40324 RepID=UPI0039C06A0E